MSDIEIGRADDGLYYAYLLDEWFGDGTKEQVGVMLAELIEELTEARETLLNDTEEEGSREVFPRKQGPRQEEQAANAGQPEGPTG